MIFCAYSPLGLLSKRHILAQSGLSKRFLRHVSFDKKGGGRAVEPTPSHLLRFALTGNTRPLRPGASKPELDIRLQELFEPDWSLGSSPPPSRRSRQGKIEDTRVVGKCEDDARSNYLRHLRFFVERRVNSAKDSVFLQTQGCRRLAKTLERWHGYNSYREILRTINGIIERLKKLEGPVPSDLYLLGIRYACLSFSAPALEHHLEGYQRTSDQRLDPTQSATLVDDLLTSLESLQFGNPGFDSSLMLGLVTGEGKTVRSDQPKLHDILYWADPQSTTKSMGLYLRLLAKLGSNAFSKNIWKRYLESLSSDSPSDVFQSAYAYIMALVASGRNRIASVYLTRLSKRAGNTLPGISQFQQLNGLLADPLCIEILPQLSGQREFELILQSQLEKVEIRLGLKWQPKQSLHYNVSEPRCPATGQSLLTIDGDSVGYDSSERLVAEIRALGCSKSRKDLGRIVNMLSEHEGSEIPILVRDFSNRPLQFAWFPRCSPIEFAGYRTPVEYDASVPWSPSTLGLIRVRRDDNGNPVGERTLHLLQLGYVGMRPAPQSVSNPSEEQPQWEDTGHIVAWDRAAGEFLIIFVGKCHEGIDPGLQQLRQPAFSLPTIEKITIPGDGTSSDIITSHSVKDILVYHLDIDPAADLTS